MPGINVTTGVRVGPEGANVTPGSTLFLVGTAERGPINRARAVVSMGQFEAIYGGFASAYTLHDSVRTFFEEGGTRCYITRVLKGASAAATIDLDDAEDAAVITLTASNPGTWGNELSATTTTVDSALSVVITYRGSTIFTGGPYTSEVIGDGSTKYPAEFATEAINGSAALSEILTATLSTANKDAEIEGATYDLTAGANGDAVTATEVAAGLALFDYDFGSGAVATPGFSGATVWNAMRNHSVANRRIALCASVIGADVTDAVDDVTGYWGDNEEGRTNASYMAFYWPWVKVPDGFGGTRAQSPEAFVAAARSRALRANGPWRAGAGNISTARYVKDLYVPVVRATADTLDAARGNALRVINGSVQVYGARSASIDEGNWRFITYRDTINYIVGQAEAALEPLVFRPIDGRGNLFGQVEAILTGVVDPIRTAGGLYEGFDPNTGAPIDPGYSVEVSSANNPVGNLANGVVTATVGVRVSPVAEQINVTISKSSLTATV
jgi:hypothetical protein